MALGSVTHMWADFYFFEAKYLYVGGGGIMGFICGHTSGIMYCRGPPHWLSELEHTFWLTLFLLKSIICMREGGRRYEVFVS